MTNRRATRHFAPERRQLRSLPIVLPMIALLIALYGWWDTNVAAQVASGGEMVGQPIQAERPSLPTISDSEPVRERPLPASAAPSTVLGLTRDGRAYVLVRDLPCRPKCSKPLVQEFTVMFTLERR